MPDFRALREMVLSHGEPCDPAEFPPLSAMEMLWATGKQAVAKAIAQTYPRTDELDWERDVDELTGEGELGTGGYVVAVVYAEPECQAIAAGAKGNYLLGVYHGLPLVIPELVTWLFGTRAFMPWMGNVATLPSLGPEGLPPGLQMLRSISLNTLSADVKGHLPANARVLRELHRATDPIRHAAAAYTISSAFRFVWLHEASHLLFGHVDLCEQNFGINAIPEAANQRETDGMPDAVSQMFELQADTVALEALIGREFSLLKGAVREGVADVPMAKDSPQYPLTPRQAAICNVLGCLLVSLVFHGQDKFLGQRDDDASSHPPLWFRAETVLKHAAETWSNDPDAGGLEGMLRDVLHSLASVHPLLGEWYGQTHGPAHLARCEIYRKSLYAKCKAYGGVSLPHKVHPSRRP